MRAMDSDQRFLEMTSTAQMGGFAMMSKKSGSLIGTLLATIISVFVSGCGGGTPPPPISVNAFSSAPTIDEGRSANITASVTNDLANRGVTWSVSGSGCAGAA